ncbi:MAG: hypothetical protein HEP71_23730 [Roseivirga sp.]|nr:hypothetical protein [Roseivirga sp.]
MKSNKLKIELGDYFRKGKLPKSGCLYAIRINKEKHIVEKHAMLGSEILALIGQTAETYFLVQKTKKGKEFINPFDIVDFTKVGIESFIAQPNACKVIDLEQFYKEDRIPVITYQYIIKINTKRFTVSEEKMTGRQILALIGATPESHFLRQRTKGGKKLIAADQEVDFTECGIERFIAQQRNCDEGFVSDESFRLPEEDELFLKNLGLPAEIIKEGATRWLIIKGYLLPEGYTSSKADVAILLHPQYPQVQLDMIYIHPAIQRVDRKLIRQLSNQIIGGRTFQRWSRHRNRGNPWIPGDDNISTHLDLMMDCLKAEFKKR